MEKVLVTGGAGFIGSNFVRYLLHNYKDMQIVNLDKLTYAGNLENLKDVEGNDNYSFVKGDVCKFEDVNKAMNGCSKVFHFAAESHVDRSIESSDEFLQTNVFGTRVMLEAARKNNVERFIQIGTDEVYGSVETSRSKEGDLLKPRNPYSASKAAADLLALSYYTTHELPVVVTRSSNNFGPYQYPEKLIPLFVTNLLDGKKVPLYGDGLNKRDWLFVEDNCTGIDLVGSKGNAGEIYNIGAGNEHTSLEITKFILKELGRGAEMIEHVKDRPGHDKRYALDVSKIKSLGWKPKKESESALKETVKWYLENENWWKPLKEGK